MNIQKGIIFTESLKLSIVLQADLVMKSLPRVCDSCGGVNWTNRENEFDCLECGKTSSITADSQCEAWVIDDKDHLIRSDQSGDVAIINRSRYYCFSKPMFGTAAEAGCDLDETFMSSAMIGSDREYELAALKAGFRPALCPRTELWNNPPERIFMGIPLETRPDNDATRAEDEQTEREHSGEIAQNP